MSDAQGWQPDPFGRHEQRYFSQGRPTKLVRNGSTESFDEPSGTLATPGITGAGAGTAGAAPSFGPPPPAGTPVPPLVDDPDDERRRSLAAPLPGNAASDNPPTSRAGRWSAQLTALCTAACVLILILTGTMLLSGGSKSPTALSTHHLPGSGTTLPDASSPPITSPTTTIPAPLAGVSGGDANTGEAALPFTAGNSSINGGIVVGGSGISGAAADVPADTPEVPTVLLLPLFGGGIFAGTVLLHRRRCTLLP